MPTVPSQNSNLFRQSPAIGQRALGLVSGSGCLSFQISANQATAMLAGARFILDPAIVSPMPFPQIIEVADNAAGLGTIMLTAKQASFSAGDVVEGLTFLGPIVYQVAAATIAPGAKVEMASGFVQTKAAGSTYGIALDPGVLNGFVRVATLMPLQA